MVQTLLHGEYIIQESNLLWTRVLICAYMTGSLNPSGLILLCFSLKMFPFNILSQVLILSNNMHFCLNWSAFILVVLDLALHD